MAKMLNVLMMKMPKNLEAKLCQSPQLHPPTQQDSWDGQGRRQGSQVHGQGTYQEISEKVVFITCHTFTVKLQLVIQYRHSSSYQFPF